MNNVETLWSNRPNSPKTQTYKHLEKKNTKHVKNSISIYQQ